MAAGDGLVSMTPTSIAHSGTSASINADGGVDFTAVTSLSLNGVFTSAYDNYLIVVQATHSATSVLIRGRLRASGADATGTDYASQSLFAFGGPAAGASRSTGETSASYGVLTSALNNGLHIHAYGPALAQPTAFRAVNVNAFDNAGFHDEASTHSLSTSYDGLTLFSATGDNTGNVHVFGYEE